MGRIERRRYGRVSRPKHSHWMHYDPIGAERHEGCRAECSVWDEDAELGAVFANQRDEAPRDYAVSPVRVEEEVDLRLLFGSVDRFEVTVDDGNLIHRHLDLKVRTGRGQVGDY